MNLSALGNRIRCARLSKNLSREQLADCLGLSLEDIVALEEGAKTPETETLVKLSNSLEVSPDYLLQDSLTSTANDPMGEFTDLLSKLSPEDRWRILCALRTFVECTPAAL